MRTVVGLLAALVSVATAAAGQERTRQESAETPAKVAAARATPARRSRYPIRESAERQIDRIVRTHLDPCLAARGEGVPCFPVSIENEGPHLSVKEALRTYRPQGGPAPGVPTSAEMQHQMSGAPLSASGGVSMDPGCAAKSLIRLFKGSPNTFFLYRTWNPKGEEEPLLTDHKLDPGSYASPAVRYEYVGQFKGECEAIAAWRRTLRNAMEPSPGEPQRRIEAAPEPPPPPQP